MWRANQILGNWFITKYFAQKTLLGENSTLENDFNIDYPMVDSSKDSKILRYQRNLVEIKNYCIHY